MVNFIHVQVGVENLTNDPDDEVSEYSDSLESFIDDDEDMRLVEAFIINMKTFSYLLMEH